MPNNQHDGVPRPISGHTRINKPMSAPPRSLFACPKPEPHSTQGFFSTPNLSRYNIHVSRADVVDRFFSWYDNTGPGPYGFTPSQSGTACMVEVIRHRDTQDSGAVYFVEYPRKLGAFEWVRYEEGFGFRMKDLELKTAVILRCKEHGCSWEVNVLG